MRARAKADKLNLKEGVDTPTFYRVAVTFTGRIDVVSDDVHTFHLKRKDTDRADCLCGSDNGPFQPEHSTNVCEGDRRVQAVGHFQA